MAAALGHLPERQRLPQRVARGEPRAPQGLPLLGAGAPRGGAAGEPPAVAVEVAISVGASEGRVEVDRSSLRHERLYVAGIGHKRALPGDDAIRTAYHNMEQVHFQ